MLTAIGDFLAIIVTPLQQAGQLLTLNAAAAATYTGTGDYTVMTTWFAAIATPFIDATGSIFVGLGDIVMATSNFLVQLSDLM
jgi:hypothetical protein